MKNIIKSVILYTLIGITISSCEENDNYNHVNEEKNLISTEHLDQNNLIGAAAATPFNTGYYGAYNTYPMPQGQTYINWAVPNLKWFFGVNPDVYNWQGANTNNMLAYSNPLRVFIGETWWNSMLNNYDAYAAKAIIAHEFGHILQYSNNWYWAPGSNQEIGADFFAGYWLASDVGQNLTWTEAATAFQNFYDIGSPQGSVHGTPSERQAAAKLGYYTGYYANSKGFLGWDKVYNLLSRFWSYIGEGRYWYDSNEYKSANNPKIYEGLSKEETAYFEFMMSNFNDILKIKNGNSSKQDFFKFTITD